MPTVRCPVQAGLPMRTRKQLSDINAAINKVLNNVSAPILARPSEAALHLRGEIVSEWQQVVGTAQRTL